MFIATDDHAFTLDQHWLGLYLIALLPAGGVAVALARRHKR